MRRCPVQFFEAGSVIELAHLQSFEVAELYNGPVWRRTLRTFKHFIQAGNFKVLTVLVLELPNIKLLGLPTVMAGGIELIPFKHASKRCRTHNQRTLNDLEFNRKHRRQGSQYC